MIRRPRRAPTGWCTSTRAFSSPTSSPRPGICGACEEPAMKYFRLIWKNVFRKKTRTVLTTGSIVLVLVLIVVLVSLLQAMEADPSGGKGSNRLIVQHATGLGNFLALSQRQRIEQIPGVVAASPEVWFD